MKATGIVRRIDDLGRVVIPNEIRRTLRIIQEIYSNMMSRTAFKSPCVICATMICNGHISTAHRKHKTIAITTEQIS